MSEERRIEISSPNSGVGVGITPNATTTNVVISPGLARRMITATSKIKALSLDGKNSFYGYRYPTIAQVRGNANTALAEAGISIIPSIVKVSRAERVSDKGKSINITAIEIEIAICSEDGAYIARWIGESEDVGDKGIQKAASAAIKAWLAHFMLMPTREDENDDGVIEARREPEPAKPALHWIDSEQIRKRFWAWAGGELGLRESDVHAALGVSAIHDYAGTMAEAKLAIEEWVAEHAASKSPDAAPMEMS